MRLEFDNLGMIPATWPKTFYRVETWNTGSRVADFTTPGEAARFAIADARERGYRYDHKVCAMTLNGR